MIAVWLLMAGCGSPDPESLRSEPITATLDLAETTVADEEIVWTDLEELFPKTAGALPRALAELVPGMDVSRAYAILDAAHQPGMRVFREAVGDTLAIGTLLGGSSNVGVTLLIRDGALFAIDVSVPDEVAVPMLTTRWGPPTEVSHQDGGAPLYRWAAAPWSVTLYGKPGDRAIVKYEAP